MQYSCISVATWHFPVNQTAFLCRFRCLTVQPTHVITSSLWLILKKTSTCNLQSQSEILSTSKMKQVQRIVLETLISVLPAVSETVRWMKSLTHTPETQKLATAQTKANYYFFHIHTILSDILRENCVTFTSYKRSNLNRLWRRSTVVRCSLHMESYS